MPSITQGRFGSPTSIESPRHVHRTRCYTFTVSCVLTTPKYDAFAVSCALRLAVDELHVHGVVAANLLRFGLIMVGLALLDSLFRFGQRMLVNGAAYMVEYDIRSAMFRRLLLLDQGFYGQAHTGDLMTRVT